MISTIEKYCEQCNILFFHNISFKNAKYCSRICYYKSKELYPEGYGSKSRLYIIWCDMKKRCYKNKSSQYKWYGAEGILVCDEWKNNYKTFMEWALNNGYEEHLTLDRIDNDEDYAPKNCRWATMIEQHNNRRGNVIITIFGETKTVSQWSRDSRCNVSIACLLQRIKKGWPLERALLIVGYRDKEGKNTGRRKYTKQQTINMILGKD